MEKVDFIDSENNTLTLQKSIEDYLESERFYDSLNMLKNLFKNSSEHANIQTLNYIVGSIIAYFVTFYNQTQDINNDLHEMIDSEIKYISNLDLNEEFNIFGFDSSERDNIEDFILNMFLKRINNKNLKLDDILSKKYIFHSFNPAFLDSIKENSLNPKAKTRYAKKYKYIRKNW